MLTFQITDYPGNVLCTLFKRDAGEVKSPVNDSRTAKTTLSVYRPEIKHVIPLENRLKVFYWDSLVFWGPLLNPNYTFGKSGESLVELNAHDPTLSWKKNYLRYGDYAVDFGYPLDGNGLAILSEAALPSVSQINRGVKHPGIFEGVDTSNKAGPAPAGGVKTGQVSGSWSRATRGTQIWDAMRSITDLPRPIGPDWNLRPIDETNPGIVADWEPGYFAEFDRFSQRMVDRRGEVVFRKGYGAENVEQVTWTPDGDKVQNYAVVVFQGGEDNAADKKKRRLAHLEAEWKRIGIYETWVASNTQDYNPDILQERANFIVNNYGTVPDFIGLTLKPEGTPGFFRYLIHYTEGDLITTSVKEGYINKTFDSRIQSVTLSDQGHETPVVPSLEIATWTDNVGTTTDEGN